jgi:hypothetical protein
MKDAVINICGYEVLISACDYDRVMAHKWRKISSEKGNYGPRFVYSTPRPERKNIYLHRFITNCPPDLCVDHINGNTLDNRQENLRVCTITQNSKNQRKKKNNTSGYKGVVWDRKKAKWLSNITVNYKYIFLGYYDTPEKAYEAYVTASKKYHGDFGRLA